MEPIGYESKRQEAKIKNNANPPTDTAMEGRDRGKADIVGNPLGEAKVMALNIQ